MHNPIQQAIESRSSTTLFDPNRELPDEIVTSLVEQATRAPSAYNFQNWRFIAVRSAEAKARLKNVAYGQQQVVDAAVTFIICGTLAAHEQLAHMLKPVVVAGIMDEPMADGWVAQASRAHADNPQLQRDEAIRSASLAAMTLMLAAKGMGLATGPMIGFDMERLSQEFALTDNDIPAIIVTVGYPMADNWPQKPRRPVQEILEWV
ncbi:NAD(P)H nitroreductase [Chania multitudinisentens RB-25]|uniref:NAD(P)H nitroreductase n=1 Tax=Chania multitudinisentens RB-25 TaxID=1441930 RepID=W0L7P2_9GAMM|nr:nitroreductase family protein [Chania multitudinisentens]AHG18369.1 NAD(P)H nitroreductase [Chania multitudinisentens RB-25]